MNLVPLLLSLPGLLQTEMNERGIPGATLAIIKDGQIIYSAGVGVASTETNEPVRAEMLFRAGSTTKMMTAAALLQLSLDGKIALDEPIGNRVPTLPPGLRGLTIHQLLSHTSGLIPDTGFNGSHDDSGLAANIMSWDEKRFFTKPGRVYSYSNHGYALAGYLVEKLSGKPFADAVREMVFRPAGMARTTFRPLEAMTYPLSQGHNEKGAVVRPSADHTGFWPAGSMFTNVLELARFADGFMKQQFPDKRLDGRVVAGLTTPRVVLPTSPAASYGYGVIVEQWRGITRWSHSGSREGYGSMLIMAPEQNLAIALMTNRSGANLPRTLEKIQEALLPAGPAPLAPTAARFAPGEMERYAGVYARGTEKAELTVREGKLWLAAPGGPVEVTRMSDGSVRAHGRTGWFSLLEQGRMQYLHVSGLPYERMP